MATAVEPTPATNAAPKIGGYAWYALALLTFSKKHAAKQIQKTLKSAVANAEQAARTSNEALDVDALYVKHAVINEGPKLKRFMPAAQGRATPIQKRTSHVEIVVAERGGR